MIILKPLEIETIAPSVIRSWSADRRLVIYTVEDEKRPTLDAWLASVESLSMGWPQGQTMRLCYEFIVGANFQAARYVMTRFTEITAQPHPASKIYTAFVLPNMFLVGALRILSSTFMLNVNAEFLIKTESFSQRQKALDWLMAQPD